MLFFGVVSSLSETAFELFLEREQAEAFIAEVERRMSRRRRRC
jgi:hypothetical protein